MVAMPNAYEAFVNVFQIVRNLSFEEQLSLYKQLGEVLYSRGRDQLS
jgi:hypothetical protein